MTKIIHGVAIATALTLTVTQGSFAGPRSSSSGSSRSSSSSSSRSSSSSSSSSRSSSSSPSRPSSSGSSYGSSSRPSSSPSSRPSSPSPSSRPNTSQSTPRPQNSRPQPTVRTNDRGETVKTQPHRDGRGSTETIHDSSGKKIGQTTTRQRPDGSTATTKQYKQNINGQQHDVTEHANGAKTVRNSATGAFEKTHPSGARTVGDGKGNNQSFDRNGRLTSSQNVSVNSRGEKVVQRNVYHNYNGNTYVNHYGSYHYGGYYYPMYHPFFFYHPFFYGYMLGAWSSPYPYSWGYNPYWYGYYAPPAVYYTPSDWLVSYMIINSMASNGGSQQAQQQMNTQAAANGANNNLAVGQTKTCTSTTSTYGNEATVTCTNVAAPAPTEQAKAKVKPITKTERDMMSAQVQEVIQAEKNKEVVGVDMAIKKSYTYIVPDEMTVTPFTDSGALAEETCTISAGDWIRIVNGPTEDSGDTKGQPAKMTVVTSQGDGCEAGTKFAMSMGQLNELHNNFHETLEKGKSKLHDEKIGPAKDVQSAQQGFVAPTVTGEKVENPQN